MFGVGGSLMRLPARCDGSKYRGCGEAAPGGWLFDRVDGRMGTVPPRSWPTATTFGPLADPRCRKPLIWRPPWAGPRSGVLTSLGGWAGRAVHGLTSLRKPVGARHLREISRKSPCGGHHWPAELKPPRHPSPPTTQLGRRARAFKAQALPPPPFPTQSVDHPIENVFRTTTTQPT